MKILIVGGGFQDSGQITGYMVAVREISAELAREHEVLAIPIIPYMPKFENDHYWRGVKIMSKRPTISLFFNSVRILNLSKKRVKEYLRMYNDKGISIRMKKVAQHSLSYAYNRSFFEKKLGEIGPDVIHVHGVSIQMLPFHDALMAAGIPYITTAHGLYSNDPLALPSFDGRLEGDLLRAINERRQPITFVSNGVCEEAARTFSLDKCYLHVVHNGVDTKRFTWKNASELRRKHGLPLDKKVIITVGTVCERKNQRAVVEALCAMEDGERRKLLYLVVGGGDTQSLKRAAEGMGVQSSVMITGKVDDESLTELFQLSDVFTLTSTSEGFGLVFLEAMAAGLPIITYADLAAVKELYNEDCMTLVNERTPEMLANAILEVTGKDADRDVIREMSEKWDWASVCRDYMELYRRSLKPLEE